MSDLATLLLDERRGDAPIALGAGPGSSVSGAVSFDTFRRDVADLCARLGEGRRGGWLVAVDDAYGFAVSLFALWHSGRYALLPPNRQPSTLESLGGEAAGTISDDPEWSCTGRAWSPFEGDVATTGSVKALRAPLARDALAVALYTSGTTGAAKPFEKRLRHLDDEVRELRTLWDPRLGDAALLSTASHEHLYGLLFGVLWPLASGRPFHRKHPLHLSEILARAEDRPCALASVPTTLRRMVRHDRVEALRGRCPVVFSSGGPLAADTGARVAQRVGHAPIEVLGSTETGGIAWRQQRLDRAPESTVSRNPKTEVAPDDADWSEWTPFPSVEIERDAVRGELRVHSPFVSTDDGEGGFRTGDRIELRAGGRFALQGRADRIVKVGEQRLDLDEMASALRGHECVDDVALLTLERSGEARVAAVLVLSARGETLRGGGDGSGEGALRQSLRAHLGLRFDPVLHPRFWRIVSELPATSQGKIPRDVLLALFGDGPANTASLDRPELYDEERRGDRVVQHGRVPHDLSCFAGHFPGHPLVPGVLQLEWALSAAQAAFGVPFGGFAIESLKLRTPLHPGAAFTLRVTRPSDARLEFSLFCDDSVFSTGRLRLDPSTADSP